MPEIQRDVLMAYMNHGDDLYRYTNRHEPLFPWPGGSERYGTFTEQIDQLRENEDDLRRVWDASLEVWRKPDDAVDFLFRKHMLLEGEKPIVAVFRWRDGPEQVISILRRLQYGSAA